MVGGRGAPTGRRSGRTPCRNLGREIGKTAGQSTQLRSLQCTRRSPEFGGVPGDFAEVLGSARGWCGLQGRPTRTFTRATTPGPRRAVARVTTAGSKYRNWVAQIGSSTATVRVPVAHRDEPRVRGHVGAHHLAPAGVEGAVRVARAEVRARRRPSPARRPAAPGRHPRTLTRRRSRRRRSRGLLDHGRRRRAACDRRRCLGAPCPRSSPGSGPRRGARPARPRAGRRAR